MLLKFQNLAVLSWIISYLIDTVPASETMFQLPALQGSPYTLDDVRILPRDGEEINVTLSTTDNSITPETLTLTYGEGFRVNNKSNFNNFTIENGILVTTSENATVIISFRTWQLHVHSTDMCSERYVFEQNNQQRHTSHAFVLIQPLEGHTFANICISDISDDKDELDHRDALSEGIKVVFTNCTQVEAVYPKGLILKNVSSFHRLEINTNQAVCVFQGYISNSFYQLTIQENYNSSLTTMQPTKWSYVPEVRERSNQYLLIPLFDGRETILYILSEVNTTLNICTDGNVTQYSLTADEPLSINIDIDDGNVALLSSDTVFSISCSYISNDEDLCQLIPRQHLNNLIVQNSHWSLNYTWIYYTVDVHITFLCQDSVEYVLTKGDTSADINETRTFVVSGQMYQVLFLHDVIPGLYKMSFNCSISRCAVIYSNLKNYQSDLVNNDKHKYKVSNDNETSTTTNANLTSSANFIYNFTDSTTRVNTDWTALTESHELNITSSDTTMPSIGSATVDAKDIATQTEIPVVNESTTELDNKEQYVNIPVKPQKGDVNERFRVVVDILQSKDGHVDILRSSKDSEAPKYVYTDEYSGYMGVSDNKSFTAIMSSLGAALLAVIILILGFLLKEVFSRRQQRRNTRIRPFVSYY